MIVSDRTSREFALSTLVHTFVEFVVGSLPVRILDTNLVLVLLYGVLVCIHILK